MTQDTTLPRAPAPLPPLLCELWRLLAAQRPAVHQARCFDRLRAVVLGHLCTAARHTLTQVLLALGLVDAGLGLATLGSRGRAPRDEDRLWGG